MARMGFAIDNRVCIGCHACTVACKAEHSVPLGVNRTWVKYIEKGTFPTTTRSFSVQRCNHCEDAPCVEICPVTALFQRPDGIVDFDSDRCIGCTSCMQACPYDALYLDPETDTAAKCNFCAHRVDRGYEPACVVVCPVEAIVTGDLDDPTSKLAILDRTQRVQYPKPEKNTKPKLFYVGGETAALDPTQAPPRTDYLWSGADLGVTPRSLAQAEREADESARARRVYDVKPKPSTWGWKVSAYITTKAVGAGTVLVAVLMYVFGSQSVLPPATTWTALLFLGVTGGLLVADLKRPERFLYVMLRPQWRSWLVRGAYLIAGFVPLVLVGALLSAWGAPRAAQLVVGVVTGLFGVGVAIYTALLLAQAKGRDYWQNPLFVVAMLADALVAGVVVATLLGTTSLRGGMSPEQAHTWLSVGVLVLALLILAEFAPRHATGNAALTARMILRGRYAALFWGGVIGLGIAAPAFLLLIGAAPAAPALLLLIGIALRNHILIQAPQQVPLS